MIKTLLLAGGVGGARFLRGLAAALPADHLDVIVNTADDDTFHGLHVSPDVDTLLYTLAGKVDPAQGWGLRGDRFDTMDALAALGEDVWFRLGNQDLATHLFRTTALQRGESLTEVTRRQSEALGVAVRIRPMSDDRVRTIIHTPKGKLAFQEYLVRDRARSDVRKITYAGIRTAKPAPGILDTIARADLILIAPSNPFVSIGPILALPGVRGALRKARAPIIGVSPLIGGRTVKGPADRMMRGLGFAASPRGLVTIYKGLLDGLLLDEKDQKHQRGLVADGIAVECLPILMNTATKSRHVAQAALTMAAVLRTPPRKAV
jgi:LPPG:FO 2-phospho-L-lactate transferase